MNKAEFIPLKYIADQRGSVLHYIKINDDFLDAFGECYFSWVNPSYVKGWYCHTRVTSCLTSPTTNLKVVLHDLNKNVQTFNISQEHYGIVKIPAGVWYCLQSTDNKPALIVNLLNEIYDPYEVQKRPLDAPEFLSEGN